MTNKEFSKRLNELLESMIGEDVYHETFGLGTIIGFDDNKCIVKYDKFDGTKSMDRSRFFTFNEPVAQETIDKLNEIKCEHDLEKLVKPTKNEVIQIEDKPTNNVDKITFDDVIGLDNVKELIYQMVVYPFKYKDIYKAFKRDSGGGILLYGAPGTGKTMIAKAIANEIEAKFFSLKCSDIASKWYGESERKIKEIFEEAKKHERSIIFFDEFDSLGVNREENTSHSANMVVSQLLSQIDGFESKTNTILLIASTNKPWNIDSALLRSGRFNKKIYIGLPNQISRENLFIHEMKELPVDKLDYALLSNITDGFSNADIVEFCNTVKDIAIKRSIKIKQISPITNDDFKEGLEFAKSTVVKKELDKLANFEIK